MEAQKIDFQIFFISSRGIDSTTRNFFDKFLPGVEVTSFTMYKPDFSDKISNLATKTIVITSSTYADKVLKLCKEIQMVSDIIYYHNPSLTMTKDEIKEIMTKNPKVRVVTAIFGEWTKALRKIMGSYFYIDDMQGSQVLKVEFDPSRKAIELRRIVKDQFIMNGTEGKLKLHEFNLNHNLNQLDDEKSLIDQGIFFSTTLILKYEYQQEYILRVYGGGFEQIYLSWNFSLPCARLYEDVAAKINRPVDKITLSYYGTKLAGNKSLEEHEVSKGAPITLNFNA